MAEVKCDRCHGATTAKQITSKKDGKQYTIHECVGTCMNGKFKYSCFAPKEAKPQQAASSNEATKLLKSIDDTLKKLLALEQEKQGILPDIQPEELQPDEEVPF